MKPVQYVITFQPYFEMQPDMYSQTLIEAFTANEALAKFKVTFDSKGYIPHTIAAVPRSLYDATAVKYVSVRTHTSEVYYV